MPKMIRPALLVGATALTLAACSSPAVSASAGVEASASVIPAPTAAESGSDELGLTGEAAANADHLIGRAECGELEQDGSDLMFTCTFAENGVDYGLEVPRFGWPHPVTDRLR
ncbi:MAG: hypothetical protein ACR2K4_09455 [Candidatus Limnocylindria bacterium]